MQKNLYHYYFLIYRFDLELESWGIDVNVLKEPAISRTFVGWTKDLEKDK